MRSSPNSPDFAAKALNILPPGQNGNPFGGPHTADQIPLYDGLTPKFDSVSAADLDAFFKPAPFGLGQPTPERVETPSGHPGLRIERDRFGVPHVFGETRDDVAFGAGWVTAEDRGFLIDLLRKPARLGALDAPGIDPFTFASSFRHVRSKPADRAIPLEPAWAAGGCRPEGTESDRGHPELHRRNQRLQGSERGAVRPLVGERRSRRRRTDIGNARDRRRRRGQAIGAALGAPAATGVGRRRDALERPS